MRMVFPVGCLALDVARLDDPRDVRRGHTLRLPGNPVQLDRPDGSEQLGGEIPGPTEHTLFGSETALENPLINGKQQFRLKIEVAGKLFLHHGSQAIQPHRRRVAGDVAEVNG